MRRAWLFDYHKNYPKNCCNYPKFWTVLFYQVICPKDEDGMINSVESDLVGWLCWGLTSQSTIFQSCRDGAIASWVINQYFRSLIWVYTACPDLSFRILEPPHDKTNKLTFAPSKDSDQPGHPPSLIRVFAVHMKKQWVLSYPLSTQQRLWSDWADRSSLGAQIILLVLSRGGSFRIIMVIG